LNVGDVMQHVAGLMVTSSFRLRVDTRHKHGKRRVNTAIDVPSSNNVSRSRCVNNPQKIVGACSVVRHHLNDEECEG